MTKSPHPKPNLPRMALAALICLAATACTTTGSSSAARPDTEPRGSVTIFGDIDAGVSRVR